MNDNLQNQLTELRDIINKLDKTIADMLKIRYESIEKISKIKCMNNIPIFSPEREKLIFDNLENLCNDEFQLKYLQGIFFNIIKAGRNNQYNSINLYKTKTNNKRERFVEYELIKNFFGVNTKIFEIPLNFFEINKSLNLDINNYFIIEQNKLIRFVDKNFETLCSMETLLNFKIICEINYKEKNYFILSQNKYQNDSNYKYKALLFYKARLNQPIENNQFKELFLNNDFDFFEEKCKNINIIFIEAKRNHSSSKIDTIIKEVRNLFKIDMKILGFYPKNYYFCY